MMTRLSFVLVVLALGLFFAADVSAQCPSRGSGGVQSASRPIQSPGLQTAGLLRGFQGGGQGGQLLTGPGSHFHDVMMQNMARQQYARQQAMFAAAKQAKRNARKQAQLETRKRQREAELARREEKKRQARLLAQLQVSSRSQSPATPTSLSVIGK